MEDRGRAEWTLSQVGNYRHWHAGKTRQRRKDKNRYSDRKTDGQRGRNKESGTVKTGKTPLESNKQKINTRTYIGRRWNRQETGTKTGKQPTTQTGYL
jgi:hypothetical protein